MGKKYTKPLKERKKQSKREMRGLLITGCFTILLGIFFVMLPFLPPTPYEEYTEKEVVIVKFDRQYVLKGRSYHYIVTADGERYRVSGAFNRAELSDLLSEETPAVIKCDKHPLLPYIKRAEEVIVNGKTVVAYNNDEPVNWTVYILLCLLLCSMGVGLIALYRYHLLDKKRKKQKKLARKIKKQNNAESEEDS